MTIAFLMNFVSEDLEQYCLAHSTPPSEVCTQILAYTNANVPFARMISGPLVGSFIGLMVQVLGAKRVLEIGCFTGYSALSMAERLPDDGEVVTLDINPETMRVAQTFWDKSPHGRKIKPIAGPALETLKGLSNGFDLVFIDADKANYLKYTKRALELLKINGLIIVDNALWSGEVLKLTTPDPDSQAIKDFNDYIRIQPDLASSLIPVRDGLMLVKRRN